MNRKIILLISILLLAPLVAIAARYTDNGDGTVTDNATGLMWQQEDDDTVRMWHAAITYCENLVVPPSTYSDWRLPTSHVLRGIVVGGPNDSPSINTFKFPNTKSLGYWSSSTYAKNPNARYGVSFAGGYVYIAPTHAGGYVRCVRGGQ